MLCWILSDIDGYDTGSKVVFFLMIRRPPRSTQSRSSAASDVYKRQLTESDDPILEVGLPKIGPVQEMIGKYVAEMIPDLSLIHISEPTRPY